MLSTLPSQAQSSVATTDVRSYFLEYIKTNTTTKKAPKRTRAVCGLGASITEESAMKKQKEYEDEKRRKEQEKLERKKAREQKKMERQQKASQPKPKPKRKSI